MKAPVSGAHDKGAGKEGGAEESSREMEELVLHLLCGVGADRYGVREGREAGSLTAPLHLLLTEASTPMPSPSPSPSSLQLPTDQTSKHLLKPDRNLARALSTGQCDLPSSNTGFQT